MSSLLTQFTTFTSTTSGRDKLYRTIQYTAKLLSILSPSTARAPKWNELANAMSTGRKLFRVGKPIDHALAFVKCTDMKNETLRLAGMVKNASFGTWLMLDTMQYLHSIAFNILDNETLQTVNTTALRCWMTGLIASAIANGYKVIQIQKAIKAASIEREPEKVEAVSPRKIARGVSGRGEGMGLGVLTNDHELRRRSESPKKNVVEGGLRLSVLATESEATVYDLIQDIIDMTLPGAALGYAPWNHLSPSMVALAGIITSLMGGYKIWPAAI